MDMKGKWTATLWTLALVAGLVMSGCSKKPPATADDMTIETEAPKPVEDVKPPKQPDTTADVKPDPLAGDLVEAYEYAVKQGLLGDVYFDYDKYELKSDSRQRLEKNAAFMRDYPNFVFGLEGHCDERGTNEYNLALGERRANAAKSYLVSLGVDPARLRTISYGEERPFCTEHHEGCWSKNRRAHFVITGRTSAG
jgi:peptidoglycan-associated lipoprotein